MKLKTAGGSTPLMFAALYGNAESVSQLIERGADVNAANEAGATALMWSADDADITRVLLEHGADPNATSTEGATPLLIALRYKHTAAVVKLLLDHGVKLDAKPLPGPQSICGCGRRRTNFTNANRSRSRRCTLVDGSGGSAGKGRLCRLRGSADEAGEQGRVELGVDRRRKRPRSAACQPTARSRGGPEVRDSG